MSISGGASALAANATALEGALQNVPSIPLGNGMSLPSGATASTAVSTLAGNESMALSFLGSPSRIASFIIGIILVGGGILMFKGTQTIVTSAARLAA